jgi:hypothetical protein
LTSYDLEKFLNKTKNLTAAKASEASSEGTGTLVSDVCDPNSLGLETSNGQIWL